MAGARAASSVSERRKGEMERERAGERESERDGERESGRERERRESRAEELRRRVMQQSTESTTPSTGKERLPLSLTCKHTHAHVHPRAHRHTLLLPTQLFSPSLRSAADLIISETHLNSLSNQSTLKN